jgi:hypothetical protein
MRETMWEEFAHSFATHGEKWRTMAKAKSTVRNDLANRCNEIKPGAVDENRTRGLILAN